MNSLQDKKINNTNSDKLQSRRVDIETTVNKLQIQSNAIKSLQDKQTNDTNSDKRQSHMAEMEKQLYQTHTDKYNITVEVARLESLLKAEKQETTPWMKY